MKARQGFIAPRRIINTTETIHINDSAKGPQDEATEPVTGMNASLQPSGAAAAQSHACAPLSTVPKGICDSTSAYGSVHPKRALLTVKTLPAKAPRLEPPRSNTSPDLCTGTGPASEAPKKTEVFAVLYTKKELLNKKKASKKYADGVLTIFDDGSGALYDQDSKVVTQGRIKRFGSMADADLVFEIGNWHAEVDRQLAPEDFKTGACFIAGNTRPSDGVAVKPGPLSVTLRKPAPRPFNAGSLAGRVRNMTGMEPSAVSVPAQGLHDPSGPGAVILNAGQWDGGRGRLRDGRPVAPVVIDPYIGRHLRRHQEEGVRFMYEAVMGLRTPDKMGCILADEMGLGKTLQVITLAWTLLRQGPEGRPLAAKVLVVTPATLVDNWGREVKKWLGSERLQTLCLQQSSAAKQQILEFRHGCHQRMMITSYETLRKHANGLKCAFDLLVCDEGHRLKSVGGNKTIDALLSLDCPRRILLTGTPVQNDLKEFYALLFFVVPDVLGTPAVFNRVYGIPITRAQEATATAEEKELGEARASELQAKVSVFILRRTQALLAKHLPPLTSLTVFCKPSDQQIGLYSAILRSKAVASLLYGSGGCAGEDNTLAVITALRKVANHPDLLLDPTGDVAEARDGDAANSGHAPSSSCLPSFNKQFTATGLAEGAGKMRVLSILLSEIASRSERCVVVSTSTAALDLVGDLVCKAQGLTTVRIDGATSVDGRQTVVDNFNKLGMGQVFLLSTRAGGAGLNLVGASHLVLYDSDWNPAMDQQAMARIWRDGQTKPCFVYRLLTTGTIEEKVYQRQLMKADLASATVAGGAVGGSGKGGKFTREELRQLFSLNINTASDTLDLLPQGKVAGLRWMEPEEVLGDGSPLAMAVASGLVTCLNETKTTAGEAADNRPLSEGLGTQLPADACTGSPSESHEVHSDDNGDAGAPESPSFTEVEGENLCGSDGAVTREEDVHAAGTAMHKDNVDCLDILEDW